MDPLDFELQNLIGGLETTLIRADDSASLSPSDRLKIRDWRGTVGQMRLAVVQVGESAPTDAVPPDVALRIAALQARIDAILDQWDPGTHLGTIGDSLDDTIRIMNVVGKWPPA